MTPTGSAFTATERSSIAAVGVSIEVQANPDGLAKAVRIENTVGIPNLSFSRLGL